MSDTVVITGMEEMATSASQFLTFELGGELYAIEILKVQEIKGFEAVTPIPNAPAFVKGMINLRGAVVPIIDMRAKFGIPEKEYDKFTVVIVVNVADKVVGVIVDAVSDVLNFNESDLRPTPDLGEEVDTSFMKGVAQVGDQRLVTLLDIDRVVGADAAVVALETIEEPVGV